MESLETFDMQAFVALAADELHFHVAQGTSPLGLDLLRPMLQPIKSDILRNWFPSDSWDTE